MWVRLSEHRTVWQCPQGSDQPLDKVGNMSVKAVDRYQKHTRYQRLLFKGQQGYTFLSKYMTFLKSQQIVLLTLTLQFLLFATLAKNLTVGPLAKNAILLLVSLSQVLTLFLLLFFYYLQVYEYRQTVDSHKTRSSIVCIVSLQM